MASDAVIEFTDDNFEQEVLKAEQPVLVDFWAVWCPPCVMLAPAIDALAKEFHGKVKIGKLDIDANRQTTVKFGIASIPTVILFKDGQIVRTFVGLQPKKEFAEALRKAST